MGRIVIHSLRHFVGNELGYLEIILTTVQTFAPHAKPAITSRVFEQAYGGFSGGGGNVARNKHDDKSEAVKDVITGLQQSTPYRTTD